MLDASLCLYTPGIYVRAYIGCGIVRYSKRGEEQLECEFNTSVIWLGDKMFINSLLA